MNTRGVLRQSIRRKHQITMFSLHDNFTIQIPNLDQLLHEVLPEQTATRLEKSAE